MRRACQITLSDEEFQEEMAQRRSKLKLANGQAALYGMLTSCAAGVVVVNVDNGFGSAAAAARMLRRHS